MAETASGVDTAVVKFFRDDVGVDGWGERQGRLCQAVFELGDGVCLPVQAADLPRAESESGDGDDCWMTMMGEGIRGCDCTIVFLLFPGGDRWIGWMAKQATNQAQSSQAHAFCFRS